MYIFLKIFRKLTKTCFSWFSGMKNTIITWFSIFSHHLTLRTIEKLLGVNIDTLVSTLTPWCQHWQRWHLGVNIDTKVSTLTPLTLLVSKLTPVSILTLFYWHFWHGVNFDTLVFDTFDTFWHLSSPISYFTLLKDMYDFASSCQFQSTDIQKSKTTSML